jgi:hypothetical protein
VLRALGRDERLAESSLRFSLGRPTTAADVDAAVAAVGRALGRLRTLGGCSVRTFGGGSAVSSQRYNALTWRYFTAAAGAGVLEGARVGRGAAGSSAQRPDHRGPISRLRLSAHDRGMLAGH